MSLKQKPNDKFNWSTTKTAIEIKPRQAKPREVATIIYGQFEAYKEHFEGKSKKTGAPYNFDKEYKKLPCRWSNGSEGFILLDDDEFVTVARDFEKMGFPAELPYMCLRVQ